MKPDGIFKFLFFLNENKRKFTCTFLHAGTHDVITAFIIVCACTVCALGHASHVGCQCDNQQQAKDQKES